jgi:hypothetical protein
MSTDGSPIANSRPRLPMTPVTASVAFGLADGRDLQHHREIGVRERGRVIGDDAVDVANDRMPILP